MVADYAIKTLAARPGKPQVWAVGERVHARLSRRGDCPWSASSPFRILSRRITPLVGRIQVESETQRAKGGYDEVYVFHNRKQAGAL